MKDEDEIHYAVETITTVIPSDAGEDYEPLSYFPPTTKQSIMVDVGELDSEVAQQFLRHHDPSKAAPAFASFLSDNLWPKISKILEGLGYPPSLRLVRVGANDQWIDAKDFELGQDLGVGFLGRRTQDVVREEVVPRHKAETLYRIVKAYEDLSGAITAIVNDTAPNWKIQQALLDAFRLGEAITHYQYATNRRIIDPLRKYRRSVSAPSTRVPQWERALFPVVVEWCRSDPSMGLMKLARRVDKERPVKHIPASIDAIKDGLRRMEKYEEMPLVIPNRG